MFAYIGPGLGFGSILLVLLILLLIVFSVGVILWIPVKRFFNKVFFRRNK